MRFRNIISENRQAHPLVGTYFNAFLTKTFADPRIQLESATIQPMSRSTSKVWFMMMSACSLPHFWKDSSDVNTRNSDPDHQLARNSTWDTVE
ncbi:hypothetical protein Pmani_007299 [Petrolisthes manimaculis]|uniref:Uncharacterized protein n=1 Tax=Petrolisthes manimaculis TaxID=1843537 RepID=A0AAE1UFS2_9EUCA|nr:hypothetical protein Pmani_007299 [Petrolisthes manimaculis]